MILFIYVPMYGVLMAFQDYNPTLGISGSRWVGFANFISYFKSWQFVRTLRNTLTISLTNCAVVPAAHSAGAGVQSAASQIL